MEDQSATGELGRRCYCIAAWTFSDQSPCAICVSLPACDPEVTQHIQSRLRNIFEKGRSKSNTVSTVITKSELATYLVHRLQDLTAEPA